jgi:hypothetical protein
METSILHVGEILIVDYPPQMIPTGYQHKANTKTIRDKITAHFLVEHK